jgi:nucleoside phosphorylase
MKEVAAGPRPYFDVLVIVPLEEELEVFFEEFPQAQDFSNDRTFRSSVQVGEVDPSVLVVRQDGMGKAHATSAASTALQDFDVGMVICLGIAGSLSNDLKLGDVCYSTSIMDVLDNAKVSDDKDKLNVALSPSFFMTDHAFVGAFNFMRLKANAKPEYTSWEERCTKAAEALLPSEIKGRHGRLETIRTPKSKEGTIVCRSVTDSESYNERLKQTDRKVLAIETESGGIFPIAQMKGIPAMSIRGISDYANPGKNALEASTANNVRKLAAGNAARFLRLQLRNPDLRSLLQKRRAQSVNSDLIINTQNGSKDLIHCFEDIATTIDEALRELSPEFRLQPKGYRLPVPRLVQTDETNVKGKWNNPIDLIQALDAQKAILIKLPRIYPDYSLPWVLADELITAEISGKPIIPIVIDGMRIGPPKNGLSELARSPIDNVRDIDDAQIIYIIDEIPLASRTRLSFLKKEIEKAEGAKFIFVSREDSALVALTDFANGQKADTFNLSAISFEEIAHFVEKNFDLGSVEAEVIAKRLRDTFQRFDLSAHPTYFAGLSKETLSALLQANRRSELIQLAVDGFLTFLVAQDQADVPLSRTTRSRFLRRLVLAINVEKRSFSDSDIIKYTEEFSNEFDFEIQPIAFNQAFIEKGILAKTGNRIRFSLPFIEAYLLADELHNKPEVAKQYFDVSSDHFDLATFDLYSEIGASDELISRVVEGLKLQLEKLKVAGEGNQHALESTSLMPALLSSPERVTVLQTRLKKAMEDVHAKRGDVKAKQRVLDMTDHVREVAAEATKKKDDESANRQSDATASDNDFGKLFKPAVQAWAIGVVLLGAGAEHLKANAKQELAGLLVEIGSVIVHHWTKDRAKIDFKHIKSAMLADDLTKQLIEDGANTEAVKDAASLVETIVDVIEYHLLSQPFRRVLDFMCEQARQKVLASSVEKSTFHSPIPNIIHRAWLTDIDSKRGKSKLNEAIKSLPGLPFLRAILFDHFITRVHWSHWKSDDRLALLEAADETLKPVARTIANKGELKRAIERDADTDE